MLKRAHEGDVKLRRILERYGSMIAAKRESEKWKQLVRDQLVGTQLRFYLQFPSNPIPCCARGLTNCPVSLFKMEENMMRHRAILTGTFQRATYYNKPLPRMKVQPLHVSGMIRNRLRARERRHVKQWTLMSLKKHIEAEAKFERVLEGNAARFGQKFESVFQHIDWCECILLPRIPRS